MGRYLSPVIAAVVAVLFVTSSTRAQEAPAVEQLAAAVGDLLPPWWAVAALEIKASANLGDAVQPRIKQRIEAAVAPAKDLYVVDPGSQGAFGPFLPLVETVKAGTSRTLYVVSEATYAAGQWTIGLTPENGVADLGRPLDMFAQPTVVRGSDEEKALVARLRSDIAAQAKEELDAALAAARQAHAAAMQELGAKQAAELAKLQAAQAGQATALAAELKRAGEAANAQLDGLRRAHEKRLAAMRESFAAVQSDAGKTLEQQLAALKGQQAADLARLEQEHQGELEQLKSAIRQRRELTALEVEKQKADDELTAARLATTEKQHAAARATQEQDERLRAEAQLAVAAILERLKGEMADPDAAVRLAAFDAALASDDQSVRAQTIRLAMDSEDVELVRRAVAAGLESGTWELQRFAILESLQRRGSFSMIIYNRRSKSFASSEIEETKILKLTEINPESGIFASVDGDDAIVGEISSPGMKIRGRYSWQAAVTDTGALRGCGGSDCRNPIEIDLRF